MSDVTLAAAQREVRTTFLGGFPGGIVSGSLWLLSAALATWVSLRGGILTLVVGGMFIFPMTQLLLRAMGRKASLSAGSPMNALAMQTAFVIPALLPLVGAATLSRAEWFYPAMALVVGAHYLPFATLYGMRAFLALAVIMCGVAAAGLAMPRFGISVGWITGVLLIGFAVVGRRVVAAEARVARS
jgi:hypothetical protein